MPKRLTAREQLTLKIETLTDMEVAEVLDYLALNESKRKAASNLPAWDDELVAVLSDARENRRARQAFAWESLRRRSERRLNMTSSRAS